MAGRLGSIRQAGWRKAGARAGAGLLAAGLVAGMMPQAAHAQTDDRLNRIETQLRALQRVVFPGGDQRFFEPEITADNPAAQARPANAPTASALTDVLARLDAIELQLARLTAATEVNQNAVSLLEGRLAALEAAPVAAAASTPTPSGPVVTGGSAAAAGNASGPAELVSSTQLTTPVEGPTPERLAGVQAITKPATDDAGDDEYVYGFRLWDAHFYPEAQQQLALFLERYPTHSRVSYARNLLGRAYLDAGEPRRAATHFFENYQADKQGARAADSLLFLAESMIQLGDTRRACIALGEFGETYPALATGRLKTQYDATRGRVDCQ